MVAAVGAGGIEGLRGGTAPVTATQSVSTSITTAPTVTARIEQQDPLRIGVLLGRVSAGRSSVDGVFIPVGGLRADRLHAPVRADSTGLTGVRRFLRPLPSPAARAFGLAYRPCRVGDWKFHEPSGQRRRRSRSDKHDDWRQHHRRQYGPATTGGTTTTGGTASAPTVTAKSQSKVIRFRSWSATGWRTAATTKSSERCTPELVADLSADRLLESDEHHAVDAGRHDADRSI